MGLEAIVASDGVRETDKEWSNNRSNSVAATIKRAVIRRADGERERGLPEEREEAARREKRWRGSERLQELPRLDESCYGKMGGVPRLRLTVVRSAFPLALLSTKVPSCARG